MSTPRIRLKFGHKLFLSHFLAVVLVSGSIGSFFYQCNRQPDAEPAFPTQEQRRFVEPEH